MMDALSKLLEEHRVLVIGGAVAAALGLAGCYYYYYRRQGEWKWPVLEAEVDRATFTKRDHVYLVVPPRMGAVSNISPFCVKLETWLWMANIPHEIVESLIPSPSKKMVPYIYLNGEEMADSKFIIEKCARHFGRPLDKHLTDMERAIFIAYSRLLEEHLAITYVLHRYTVGATEFWANFRDFENKNPLVKFLLTAREKIGPMVQEKAFHRGIGRHTTEEINTIADEDLKSLSVYLGDRDFFFGRQPTVMDCIIFGHLSQLVYIKTGFPPGRKLNSEYQNLKDHTERMKNRFYPDWDNLCKAPNK